MSNLKTISEVMKELRLSRTMVGKLITAGELKHMKIGRRVFIHQDDLAILVNRARNGEQIRS